MKVFDQQPYFSHEFVQKRNRKNWTPVTSNVVLSVGESHVSVSRWVTVPQGAGVA